ncbi:MAG: hypothetical protein V4617_06640 [Gemmatimonadota bacterium]
MSTSQLRTRALSLRALACAVLVPFAAACGGLTDTSSEIGRYAAVTITARSTSATAATGTATAIVFDSYSALVPNSTLERRETCQVLTYTPTVNELRGQLRAGNAVGFSVGASNLSLEYDDNRMRYSLPAAGTFTYGRGDVATITIPGVAQGYPASSISVKLAEPVIPGAMVNPTPGLPFTVLWNETGDPTALVIISLRYGSSAGSIGEQIYCTATDDGQFELSSSALLSFHASPAATRNLSITRFRTNQTLLDPRTLLHVGTSADTVIALR